MEPDADSQPLQHELEALLNRHSCEQHSDTPDFILAQYLLDCLAAWNAAVTAREEWYGRKTRPAPFAVTPLRVGIDPGNTGVSYPSDPSWSPDFGRHGVPAAVLQDAATHVVEDAVPVASYEAMAACLEHPQEPERHTNPIPMQSVGDP